MNYCFIGCSQHIKTEERSIYFNKIEFDDMVKHISLIIPIDGKVWKALK